MSHPLTPRGWPRQHRHWVLPRCHRLKGPPPRWCQSWRWKPRCLRDRRLPSCLQRHHPSLQQLCLQTLMRFLCHRLRWMQQRWQRARLLVLLLERQLGPLQLPLQRQGLQVSVLLVQARSQVLRLQRALRELGQPTLGPQFQRGPRVLLWRQVLPGAW